MYLSRLVLDPRSREAARGLADVYQMHRTIMSAFPQVKEREGARAELAVLHRLDMDQRSGTTVLLVQSGEEPDWNRLTDGYLLHVGNEEDNPATKPISDALVALREGQVLRFASGPIPQRKLTPSPAQTDSAAMAGGWICASKHSRSSGCRAGQAGRVFAWFPLVPAGTYQRSG